jgi:hypothetical protein
VDPAVLVELVEPKVRVEPRLKRGKLVPSLSIGLVVRELPGRLEETLASLAANTSHSFDLTLLGDGLSSESLAEFKSLPQSSTEAACGIGACFNRLIQRTAADFYLLLEASARVAPAWLDYLFAVFERYPRCGQAGPSTNRAVNTQCIFSAAGDTLEEIDRIAKLCVRRFGNTCRPLEPPHSLSDFCYLVRRDVIETIGKADEGYGTSPFWVMDYNRRAAHAGFQDLWACAAYVHRAPATEPTMREEYRRDSCPTPARWSTIAISCGSKVATGQVRIGGQRASLTTPPLLSKDLSLHRDLKELKAFQGIHSGETIIVCGCGVSLKMLDNPQRFITIGVNDVGRLFHPDYLVVVNPRNQFQSDRFRYVEESQARVVFTQLDLGLRHPHVVRFNLGKRAGADFSGNALNYASNSPYVALCLAVHMGARRVGVIGVDFTNDHFFAQTGTHALARQLPQIDREYQQLYAECIRRGVEVFNLSSQSRLTAFPKLPLAELESCATPALAKSSAAIEGLRIVSYSTMPVAGVPALLARCIAARTSHSCRTVWARNHYGNGVTFQGDVEWEQAPSLAADLLKSAELVIVHNGKVDLSHAPLLAAKPVITLAHNYMWNVDDSLVQRGFPGLVVGQYQSTLPEFKQWLPVPNPVPLWEEAFRPGPKNSQLTICYTPSGKHEAYPLGHRLYWHSKGYDTTMLVLERLARRFNIRLEVIRKGQVSHAESLAMKKRAHIVIDECVTGSYHRNSLEGLALGCVVVNGLGLVPQIVEVFRTCAGSGAGIPFVYATLEDLDRILTSLVEQGPAYLVAQGQRNREWMEQHWDFRQQWKRFWQPVIDSSIGSWRPKEAGTTMSSTLLMEAPGTKCEAVMRPLLTPGVRAGLSAVVSHGGEERLPHLGATLANLRQCQGVDEIIVVDMGSSPFAEEIARHWADKYIFIRNDAVFERARSLNIGTILARYDLVLWLDNDLIMPLDFIVRAVSEMRATELDYLIPYTRIDCLSEADSKAVMQGVRNPADCPVAQVFVPLRPAYGAAGIVKRSFVLAYGGISEQFRGWGGEDDAWWYKATLLGRAGVTQQRDQYLYHLFHINSGSYVKQKESNPYYNRNVAVLKEISSVCNRDSFLKRFPPPAQIICGWQDKRIVFVSCDSGPDSLPMAVAEHLTAIAPIQLCGNTAADGHSALRNLASQSPPDAVVIYDTALALPFLADELHSALWPRVIVVCSGAESTQEVLQLLRRAGAILCMQAFDAVSLREAGLRPWMHNESGQSPLDMAITLLQPLSIILGGALPSRVTESSVRPEGTISGSDNCPQPPVWMYWEGRCPEWIRQCQQTVYKHAQDVRLLSHEDFDKLRDVDRDIALEHLHGPSARTTSGRFCWPNMGAYGSTQTASYCAPSNP